MLLRICIIATLLVCYVLSCHASEHDKSTRGRKNNPATHNKRPKPPSQRTGATKSGNKKVSSQPKNDSGCTRLGGNCQPNQLSCQGKFLRGKCSKTQQCCLSDGAWSVLCAGHHKNRMRACDLHGCGAFNPRGGHGIHKAVDLVCEEYGLVNAPFSGSLAGPVSRRDTSGIRYDGVKLLNDVHCVKILNIRPHHYSGPVKRGEPMGYVLPLQEQFSGITPHLELQMCDGSDPSPFI